MTDVASSTLEVALTNGLTLRGLCWGDPDAPWIIALHGWMDNAATFTALAPLLAPHYHLITLDMAGHGQSDHRPPGTRYHLLDNVDDLLLAVEALAPPPFHLLGHSLGASIVAYGAALNPPGLQSVMCLEGMGSLTMSADESVQVLREGVRSHRQVLVKQNSGATKHFASPELAVAARTRGVFPLSEPAARALALRALQPTESGNGWQWSTDARLKAGSSYRLTEAVVRNYLQAITVPTLMVGAEEGYYGRSPVLKERIATMSDVDVVVVPGGHHCHLETDTASAVGEAILRFLFKQVGQ